MQTVWFSQNILTSAAAVFSTPQMIRRRSAVSADSRIMILRPSYLFNNISVEHNTERQLTDTPEQKESQMTLVVMTVMWWDSKPSVHLHLDLPQTTLYLDPAVHLHNWRLWLGACYSLTWHCREADGEMYWTDCSSFCQEGMATSWQTGPEENSFAPNTTSAATSKSSLFIYSLSAELQIDMWANISEVSVKRKGPSEPLENN